MVTRKIAQLAKAKAFVIKLEGEIAADLDRELAGLPAAFGFEDIKSFVAALKESAGIAKKRGPKPKARRRRAIITDAVRARVKKLVKAGKTGQEIAATVGISLPSVQGIKKAFGLVKARGAKPKKTGPKPLPVKPKKKARKKPAPKDAPPAAAPASAEPAAAKAE